MNTNEQSPCDQADLVRDYAFDELAPTASQGVELHLASCQACASGLDRLRLTTAALRVIPDREIPQRIVFVSDQVAASAGWWAGFWNSAARLGFASACVLAIGLFATGWHRPAEVNPMIRTASVSQADIDAAVSRAVEKVHADDVRLTETALASVDSKYEEKQRNLMVAISTSLEYLQKRNQMISRSSFVDSPAGARQ